MAKKADGKPSKPGKAKASKPAAPAKATGRRHWFDEKTHAPLIEEYTRHLKTFLATMADGRVDDAELAAQEERLVKLMQEVEPQLNDALHEKVTRLLCELCAYDIMHLMHTMEKARPKTTFRG
jgi:hypothetical protein